MLPRTATPSTPGFLCDESSACFPPRRRWWSCWGAVWFGSVRLRQVVEAAFQGSAHDIVDAVFSAVQEFRGETPPNDDMTAVAIRITA